MRGFDCERRENEDNQISEDLTDELLQFFPQEGMEIRKRDRIEMNNSDKFEEKKNYSRGAKDIINKVLRYTPFLTIGTTHPEFSRTTILG